MAAREYFQKQGPELDKKQAISSGIALICPHRKADVDTVRAPFSPTAFDYPGS
jgi:hypothetical protein